MVKFYACYFQDFTAISKFHSMSDLYYKVLPGDISDQQQLIYPRRKFFFHSKDLVQMEPVTFTAVVCRCFYCLIFIKTALK